ncbi:MAG: glycosyltransferase [Deltaproteobacteria bacterium]|nr:glycosyltransferase [Deltaproteobacteria bacterium]MBI3293573.1 glycosyltransferase [Deltaproteobacteria bacterium]
MHLSLIIPAFNEAKKITHDLEAARDFLSSKPQSEVIVVDDGSRDATRAIVEEWVINASMQHTFRLLSYGGNRGKGYAIRYGVKNSSGSYVAFVDSGLCVPLSYLDHGFEKIGSGFDFAIASRRLPGAQVKREQPTYRKVGSVVFWYLMKGAMGIEVSDTQCGFKVYKGDVARDLFSHLKTDGFMFDIEALRLAKKLGYRGTEFAVAWSSDHDSRYHPVAGTWRNFRELAAMRFRDLLPGEAR